MAQTTESACLLQTGAIYTRRAGLKFPDGGLVFAGIKRGAFSLYFDDAPIYHFDLEGRWQRAFIGGVHHLKSLENAVASIDRVREGANLVLHREERTFDEVLDLDEAFRQVAIRLSEAVSSGSADWIDPPSPDLIMSRDELFGLLDRVSTWDANAWFAHRERVNRAYPGEIFRTPDARGAIELHASWGDAFGGGKTLLHGSRTPEEFSLHVRDVAKLLGKRILQSSAVFLGAADVLLRPFREQEAIFQSIREVFPIREETRPLRQKDRPEDELSLAGVDVFVDHFDERLPDAEGLRTLKRLGLRRMTLGIASGDLAVRKHLGASWDNDALRAFASNAKAAGVMLSAILLTGASSSEAHLSASSDLTISLGLKTGDLVYLIDLAEVAKPNANLSSLNIAESTAQVQEFRSRLSCLKANGVKVVRYSMEKQSV